MRRAIILIITLSLFSFGSGFYLDHLRHQTGLAYIQDVESLRHLLIAGRWQDAQSHEAFLTVRWQRDAHWLKCLISHQHIREIDSALLHLSTALSHRWLDEALPALDEAYSSFLEISDSHLPTLPNIL